MNSHSARDAPTMSGVEHYSCTVAKHLPRFAQQSAACANTFGAEAIHLPAQFKHSHVRTALASAEAIHLPAPLVHNVREKTARGHDCVTESPVAETAKRMRCTPVMSSAHSCSTTVPSDSSTNKSAVQHSARNLFVFEHVSAGHEISTSSDSLSTYKTRIVPWYSQSIEGTSPSHEGTKDELHVLILFSGPEGTPMGIDTELKSMGRFCVSMIDTLVDSSHPTDLSADHTWEYWLQNLRRYQFVLMEPVCSSFSPARRHALSSQDKGPRPLRSRDEVYGLRSPTPPFTSKELKLLQEGNYFGRRSLLLARAAYALGIPVAIESPHLIFDDQTSIFLFEEAMHLDRLGAVDVVVDQCRYGALSTKPTCFKVLLPLHLQDRVHHWTEISVACNHAGGHPPLLGKHGKSFRTQEAQVYPPALNKALARAIATTCERPRPREEPKAQPRAAATPSPVSFSLALQPQGRASLHNRSKKREEDGNAIGGLRSPTVAVLNSPSAIVNGNIVGSTLRGVIRSWKLPTVRATTDIHEDMFSSDQLKEARMALHALAPFPREWKHSVSPVRGDILLSIANFLEDPDSEIANWFRKDGGAPMGILHTPNHTGIFPKVPDDRSTRDDLQQHHDDWSNYKSAERALPEVRSLLADMHQQQWFSEYTTMDQLKSALSGQTPIFSKLGLISKLKEDGTWKHRLIWDLLQSMVNAASTQSERIILPRLIDLINDILDLLMEKECDEEVWLFIIDIKSAFHLLPLKDSEKQFFCTSVDNKFQLYHVMLFGPKAAPTIWGRFGALISRLTQAIVGTKNVRLQLYVDDPAMAIVGSESARSESILVILLWLSVCNIPLSWSKAQYGQLTTWIGVDIKIANDDVEATITPHKLNKAAEFTTKLMAKEMQPLKALASYAGILTHFAGTIPTLWPFVRPLWAVLYDTKPNSLPPGFFHTSRIATTARWFLAFVSDPKRTLARKYSINTPPLDSERWLRMSVDASPWGMGGVKWDHQWRPVEYFHAPISEDDIAFLHIVIGDSAHMPTLEALAILIAIRLWGSENEVAFAVRSDALGAIQAMANLRSKNLNVNRIAAELALDIVDKQYQPLRLTHIAGVSNVIPDFLSRLLQPGNSTDDCAELQHAKRVSAPKRDLSWWRTISFEQSLT